MNHAAHVHPEPPPSPGCTACSHAATSATTPHTPPGGDAHTFHIPAMDCAAEEAEIRAALEDITGIRALGFRLGERTLHIDADDAAMQAALHAIQNAGFDAHPLETSQPPGSCAGVCAGPNTPRQAVQALPPGSARLGMALLCALLAEGLAFWHPPGWPWQALGLAVAALAIGLSGFGVYRKGLAALRRGRLNINALMTVAVTGAFAIGQWPEAAMVMGLYALAELIEARAVDRVRHAIEGLLALAPDTAQVLQADGRWENQPVELVAVGATVRVRPGERVPLDGRIRSGTSSINQAPVTGESLPVDKARGDAVFAGTVNQTGSLEVEVTSPASGSTLARIIQAVERAQESRAPSQRLVDRFAAWYTPAVFFLALAVALGGPWTFGWEWMTAVYKALVLLVIACPCALVISTPVTVVSGLAAAARRGILIKGGVHLEQARNIRVVALDKTGTLTEGKPRLVTWERVDPAMDPALAEHIAAALAGHSDHPVSQAIAAGLQPNHVAPTDFQVLAGRGVEAEVQGQRYLLGNHRLIEERGLCNPAIEAALKAHEAQGRTVSLLAAPDRVLALFAVADTVKHGAAQAMAALRAVGITPVMLTGDNALTAQTMAAQAGITDVHADLLPEDKLRAIQALRQQHGPTAMCGDGINDAPALAQADLGIAMGAIGSDIAMEAADIVVMNDQLDRIAETVHLSRRTHAVLWQNIVLALGIKAAFLVLAVVDDASMWMAVFADMGASLLVVFNGLRLLRPPVGTAKA